MSKEGICILPFLENEVRWSIVYWTCGHVTETEHRGEFQPTYCPICCGDPGVLLLTDDRKALSP